jgi:hypothetical protein
MFWVFIFFYKGGAVVVLPAEKLDKLSAADQEDTGGKKGENGICKHERIDQKTSRAHHENSVLAALLLEENGIHEEQRPDESNNLDRNIKDRPGEGREKCTKWHIIRAKD